MALLSAMVVGAPDQLDLRSTYSALVLIIMGWLLLSHWILRDSSERQIWARMPWWLRSLVLAALLSALALNPGEDRAFIYFQF